MLGLGLVVGLVIGLQSGGIVCLHRLLLEYFAPPDTIESSADEPIQTAQTSNVFETIITHSLPPLRSVSRIARFAPKRISRRTALIGLAGLAGLIATGGGALWIYLPHPLYIYRGHAYGVNTVAWSPDGKYIASVGGSDDTVQVWTATDGRHIYTYHEHSQGDYLVASRVVWSPDSKRIALEGYDGAVSAWNATDGKHVLIYHKPDTQGRFNSQTPYTGVIDVVWSPNGKHITLTNGDGTVQVLDTTNGKSLSITHLFSPGEFMVTAAWSSDGKYLASSDQNGVVQVWDTANGSRVITYRKHGSGVNDIAWSPDGKYIASGSDDQTVQVWDAMSGNVVRLFWIPTGGVSLVTWSPDEKYIASGNFDGTVSVWQVF
jgi:WD40 repeat protein